MTSIQNFATTDPFADEPNFGGDNGISYIHIRIFQRSGRKAVTTVEKLPRDIDFKRVLKYFKKTLNCNGNLLEDENLGTVIQLQGDHRKEVSTFIIEEKIAKKEFVKMHGF
ncbi:hypothetical protein DICPUDRAFT_44503 [Dictyostelium purpureum]|uniref:SUI1 domain-containing protein n=1 Tax=Dictyostelium purpureum TaxID=5786 RepID=F0Z651_DICPU|nr:uncharacterized protein DICPUDRAFT_44503 [Dictyostelium purpureum]EGC40593.1 hypothetical protein DICPUDRAFT_44503 [Dictyostelium purpureum]|eukprot:XP_003282929.1 hypothetical protein DICPUDRAFT_44503 [Dictyostelium purpureum]